MAADEGEEEVEDGTQQEDEIMEDKNNVVDINEIVDETSEKMGVVETPSSYDVKDEKICRKKRNAEKLSKIIRKTSDNVQKNVQTQPKSQKVMRNANDESLKVKQVKKIKKEGTLRDMTNKKSSKTKHTKLNEKRTPKAYGNKKQMKQKNGKTTAKKASKKRSNKKSEL